MRPEPWLVNMRRPSLRPSRCCGTRRAGRAGAGGARAPAGGAAEEGSRGPWAGQGRARGGGRRGRGRRAGRRGAVPERLPGRRAGAHDRRGGGRIPGRRARAAHVGRAAEVHWARPPCAPPAPSLHLRPPLYCAWASVRACEQTLPGAWAYVGGCPRGRRATAPQTRAAMRRPPQLRGESGKRGDCACLSPSAARRRTRPRWHAGACTRSSRRRATARACPCRSPRARARRCACWPTRPST
jgi:hypothetical protein